MIASYRKTWLSALALSVAAIACPASLWADEVAKDLNNQAAAPVELFQAMKDGQIDVKLIQLSDREANILVTNKTKQPLSVQMPDAWGSVPVLAQKGKKGGGKGGGSQKAGGGGGAGGGAFNIAPEKTAKLEAPTVCLEHGKPDPAAQMPYEICPVEEVTSDPKVQEVLKMLGHGDLNQRAAQAATWHFTNNMSWEELANKEIKHIGGSKELYFSRAEIQAAMGIASQAQRLAALRPATTEPVVRASLSPSE